MKLTFAILAALLFAAAVPAQTTLIPITNPNWFFSPYSTYSDGDSSQPLPANNILPNSTQAVWTVPGSYFKVAFTGTSFSINVSELQTVPTDIQVIEFSLDGTPWVSYTLGSYQNAGSSENLLYFAQPGQLSPTVSHTLIVALKGSFITPGCTTTDRWDVTASGIPSESLAILSANLDNGASLVPLFGDQPLLAHNVLFLGDSITEGWNVLGVNGNSDAMQGWAYALSVGLNAESGNIGHGGQGWVAAGVDCSPSLQGSYNLYFAGKSRLFAQLFSPMPDFVFINMGTNDYNDSDQSVIQATLQSIRAATNADVPIFVIIPFGQMQQANISAAVASLSSDKMLFLIDLGVQISYGMGLNNGGVPTVESYDDVHPNAQTNSLLAARLMNQVFNIAISQRHLSKLWKLEGLGNL